MSNDDQTEQKIINEEYKLWKKNCPFLYDLMISTALEWPSLTVEWLPDKKIISDTNDIDYSIERLILGTHTNGTDTDYLMIGEVKLPTIDPSKLRDKFKTSCDVYGGFGGAAGKFEIIQKIIHNGEINKSRYMPQNSNIIATKTKHAVVNIFDRTKYPSKPIKGSNSNNCDPTLILTGHQKEGYGLDWNKYKEGYLLSSADDGLICLWDIKQLKVPPDNNNNNKKKKKYNKKMNACTIFRGHTDRVEDISWNKRDTPSVFVSVGDDKHLILWDIRNTNHVPSTSIANAHKGEVNCCSFSPFNNNLLLTGGSDKIVCLWDIRNMSSKLHCMEGHTAQVFGVDWSPHSEVHLASSSADRRVMLWDLSQIGHEQTSDDAEDGPPELLFVHGGHTDKVTDFSWNQNDPWVISSVSDNNIVQCWQITEELLTFDDCTQHVQLE